MATSKISIGWFLLRVATNKIHRLIIYGAMGATALSCAVFFFVTLFQCSPISYFWNEDQPGQCIDIEVIIALAILYSVFAVISDFIFAILPGVIVWKLQLQKRTKLLLLPLLAMGCVLVTFFSRRNVDRQLTYVFRASSAVVARFPYLPKFREPDFLCASLLRTPFVTVRGIIADSLRLCLHREHPGHRDLVYSGAGTRHQRRQPRHPAAARQGLGAPSRPHQQPDCRLRGKPRAHLAPRAEVGTVGSQPGVRRLQTRIRQPRRVENEHRRSGIEGRPPLLPVTSLRDQVLCRDRTDPSRG